MIVTMPVITQMPLAEAIYGCQECDALWILRDDCWICGNKGFLVASASTAPARYSDEELSLSEQGYRFHGPYTRLIHPAVTVMTQGVERLEGVQHQQVSPRGNTGDEEVITAWFQPF